MVVSVDATQSVRDILGRHPETGPVFEQFGLAGCGGADGPDEPLDFFARVHHVSLEALTAALSAAIDRQGEAAAASAPTDEAPTAVVPAPHRFAPFLLAALGVTMTLGATLGAINLARLTGTWGALPRASVWAHAYAQVFGFVALFVMGVAYHVVPRFLGRSLSRATWPTLVLQVGGVLMMSVSYLVPDGRLTYPARLAAALALISAAGLFALHIVGLIRAAPRSPERFEPWLVAGAAWLVVASGLTLVVAATGDPTWHHVLWPAGLYGFAGSWIFGVARRILPVFLGWRTRWPRQAMLIYGTYQVGVVAWSVGAWPAQTPALSLGLAMSRGLGAILLLGAVTAFTATIGISSRRRGVPSDPHSGYEPYIRCAWMWLFVALATGPLWTLGALASGRYGAILMLDFSSHALALGFITQMIVGISTRVLPVFTGHALWSHRATRAVLWLLNGAVAIRGLQAIVAAGFWPGAWPAIALSGPVAVAAIVLFSINVAMTLRGSDAVPEKRDLPADLADAIVADLIAIDGVRDALIRAGFTPLANPVMRATFARSITLGQAARLRGVSIAALTEAIGPLVAASRQAASPPAGGPKGGARRIPLTVVSSTSRASGSSSAPQ